MACDDRDITKWLTVVIRLGPHDTGAPGELGSPRSHFADTSRPPKGRDVCAWHSVTASNNSIWTAMEQDNAVTAMQPKKRLLYPGCIFHTQPNF